jgi:DNA-directed RNA polymerase alpha subunit
VPDRIWIHIAELELVNAEKCDCGHDFEYVRADSEYGRIIDHYKYYMLSRPLDIDMDMRVRSYICLTRAGIKTVRDVTECTEQRLLSIHNFGRKSLADVKSFLSCYGFKLKDSI